MLAVASKAFNLAEVWGMRPDDSNPCRRIERYVNPSTDPVRELSDKVAGRIVAGLEGKPSAEVVDLQKRRKTI